MNLKDLHTIKAHVVKVKKGLFKVFDQIKEPIYIADPKSHEVLYANAELKKLLKEDPRGKRCYEALQGFNSPCSFCTNDEIFSSEENHSITWEHHNEKFDRWYHCVDQSLDWHDGRKVRLEIAFDITDLKQKEEEIKKSQKRYQDAYERANFYKDLFTHDMLNILQNIKSSSQLMELNLSPPEEMDLEKMENFLKVIQSQVDRGASLISNIRKFSTIEEKELDIKPKDLNRTLEKAITDLKTRFSSKNLIVEYKPLKEDVKVKAGDLLIDAFENVLVNGVIHNESKQIKLEVQPSLLEDNGEDWVKIEFKDNGIGIPEKKKAHIFSRTRKENSGKGFGFGLSLVKRIVTEYGGSIKVENRVKDDYKKGSNFIITLKRVK